MMKVIRKDDLCFKGKENMNQDKSKIIISCLAGAAAGLGMALLVLFVLSANSFTFSAAGFLAIAVMAFFLPMCLSVLGNLGLSITPAQLFMTAVSMLICALYAYYVGNASGYSGFNNTLVKLPLYLHGMALAGTAVSAYIRRRK